MDRVPGSVVVGIDISKGRLDVACLPESVQPLTAFDNDPRGHARFVAWLKELNPRLIVLESTGGYQRLLVATLAAAGLPVVIVNPGRSETWPGPWASWPRPMPSTPGSSPASASR